MEETKAKPMIVQEQEAYAGAAAIIGMLVDKLSHEELTNLLSFFSCDEFVLFPNTYLEDKGVAIMRKVYGVLQTEGFEMKTEKKETNEGEVFKVYAKLGTMNVTLNEWMPKTCRRVVQFIEHPAEPERTIPAKPARTEQKVRIICENQ